MGPRSGTEKVGMTWPKRIVVLGVLVEPPVFDRMTRVPFRYRNRICNEADDHARGCFVVDVQREPMVEDEDHCSVILLAGF
jgi:hypothetical protein